MLALSFTWKWVLFPEGGRKEDVLYCNHTIIINTNVSTSCVTRWDGKLAGLLRASPLMSANVDREIKILKQPNAPFPSVPASESENKREAHAQTGETTITQGTY